MVYLEVKSALYALCQGYVLKRVDTARQALIAAQEASNEESKSTAGDKHDTSRAMMQIDVEQAARQLAEAEKLREELKRVNAQSAYDTVVAGSLITTNRGNYFVAIAAGKLEYAGTTYFAVSVSSPIFQALKGMKKGDSSILSVDKIQILEIG